MRTKTLLLSAAALVAGAIAAEAQSNVYSANIVGYVSVVLKGNGQYTLVANPFDDGNGNQLTNVIDSANSLPKQSQVLTWSGSTFQTIQKGGNPPVWASSVPLTPGNGFFVRNGAPNSGAPNVTNVFVGSIVVANGGSVTNSLPLNYTLNGSPIPYGGNIAILNQNGGDTNMDFGGPLTKQSQILTWDSTNQVYQTFQKGGNPALWNATVSIVPGQGFFVNNKNGPATNAVETLNLQ
jgi:hypothetical protein